MQQDNMDSLSSLQLMDLLKSEVTILREVLSHYSMEEVFIKHGKTTSLPELREKRQKLSNELIGVRKKKKGCKARNIDSCDLQLLHNQIEALDSQIENKEALLNSISLMPKKEKMEPMQPKKTLLKDDAA